MNYITSENILLIGSTLLVAGVLIGKSSYRIGLPLLLIFLIVGMGFGTDGLGIQFSDMHTAQFIGMIALCIILFSGGMDTKLSSIRPVIVPGLILSTVGVLLTALLTGVFVWWLSGMSWTNIHFAFQLCHQPIRPRFSEFSAARKSIFERICAPCLSSKAVPMTLWPTCLQ